MSEYMLLLYAEQTDDPAEQERRDSRCRSGWSCMPACGSREFWCRPAGCFRWMWRRRFVERGSEPEIVDGPFAVTKEFLAGYYVLECADLDEALRHARRIPLDPLRVGRGAAADGEPAGGGGCPGVSRPAVDPAAALERAFREERAAVLATLIRYVGDFQLAEDAVQDAFLDAAASWERGGVPANPGAWLTVAARRRAIDRVRRAAASPTAPLGWRSWLRWIPRRRTWR